MPVIDCNRWWSSLFDTLEDLVFLMDKDFTLLKVNKSFIRFTGREEKDLAGRKCREVIFAAENFLPGCAPDGVAALSEKKEIYEPNLKKWLCVTTTPIFDEANTIVGFICLSSDITRLKQAEEELKKNKEKLEIQVWGLEKTKSNFVLLYKEIKQRNEELEKAYEQLKSTQAQLIQAEKLKVIGRLAGGIAHDVKNPLSIILMGVDFLLKKIDNNDDSVHRALAEMKDAIGKANDIIKGLLDFSRPSELKIAPEDFNFIVKNALGLIKYECKKYRVEIIEELGENIPRVNTDKNKMEQVFVNIFLNAVQAMVYGGKLSVKTYIKELSEVVEEVGRRKEDTFQLGDSVVVAEISDTGPGITEDVLERIFDPFFTTKRDKGGTGLGLSVVQNIVDMHAGKIRIVTKKDGSGTVVTIMLPLSI